MRRRDASGLAGIPDVSWSTSGEQHAAKDERFAAGEFELRISHFQVSGLGSANGLAFAPQQFTISK